jgi:nucleoside-diphosphate-sugar epimerase
MQTILGAGGAIGSDLAKELSKHTGEIRLVSRKPQAVNPNDLLFPADLTNPEQVDKAVKGSEIVYVVIGFPYKTKVWKKVWPAFMRSVIDACKNYEAKLVFFDNIYMYDPDHLKGMTEETPFKPVSKKGQIRKEVAEMILEEVKKGDLKALIARAPDFLSPHNSVITEMVLKNLKKGKKANWPGRMDKIHNFIYTPDAAKATALLGNTADAFNQTWHLPTDSTPYTGMDWVTMAAEITGSRPKAAPMSAGMMKFLGIFIPVLKEMAEMNYQYERDYLFDSSKFKRNFSVMPTPANEALRKVIMEL